MKRLFQFYVRYKSHLKTPYLGRCRFLVLRFFLPLIGFLATAYERVSRFARQRTDD